MSKAVRVQPGLIVRLMQKISKLKPNRTELQKHFGATDLDLSQDQWMEHPSVSIPDLALPPIPAIGSLSILDIPLIEPLAGVDRKLTQNRSELVVAASSAKRAADAHHGLLTVCGTPTKQEKRLTVEELIQTLEMTGARVKEVRALPSGGSYIKIEDIFEDINEREYEYAPAGRR